MANGRSDGDAGGNGSNGSQAVDFIRRLTQDQSTAGQEAPGGSHGPASTSRCEVALDSSMQLKEWA